MFLSRPGDQHRASVGGSGRRCVAVAGPDSPRRSLLCFPNVKGCVVDGSEVLRLQAVQDDHVAALGRPAEHDVHDGGRKGVLHVEDDLAGEGGSLASVGRHGIGQQQREGLFAVGAPVSVGGLDLGAGDADRTSQLCSA